MTHSLLEFVLANVHDLSFAGSQQADFSALESVCYGT